MKDADLRQSMSRRGNCWDNAPQESFFGHMKDELADKIPSWSCFLDIKAAIDDWMDYYNNDRYQWQLAKLSPNQYYDYVRTGIHPLCKQGLMPPVPPAIDSTPKNASCVAATAKDSKAGRFVPTVD